MDKVPFYGDSSFLQRWFILRRQLSFNGDSLFYRDSSFYGNGLLYGDTLYGDGLTLRIYTPLYGDIPYSMERLPFVYIFINSALNW